MATKIISLNLDEETVDALDKTAEELGMSRSATANFVISATVGGSNPFSAMADMFATIQKAKKAGDQGVKSVATM